MKLQLALDMLDTADAISVTHRVKDFIDVIEIGTPLLKHEGLGVLKQIRKAFPDHEILVDLKTMDVGEYEADFCFSEGADIVIVLGVADDDTINGSIRSAGNYHAKVLVDLINVFNKPERAQLVKSFGASYVGIHSGIDQQLRGISPLSDLSEVTRAVPGNIAVAGGLNLDSIDLILQQHPALVIVGGAITGSEQPEFIAAEMKKRIRAVTAAEVVNNISMAS